MLLLLLREHRIYLSDEELLGREEMRQVEKQVAGLVI